MTQNLLTQNPLTQNPLTSTGRPKARHFAVVPAAGSGTRFGTARPKQYERLAGIGSGLGRTVLEQAVAPFLEAPWFDAVVVVVQPHDRVAAGLPGLGVPRVHVAPVGGASRRDSVLAGLLWLGEHLGAGAADWVHVHDGARPGLPGERLEALRQVLERSTPGAPVCGALLALPVVDTLKAGPHGQSERTLDREGLWLAQTPQTFRLQPLLEALQQHPQVTDEASAMEAQGHQPVLLSGSRLNAKITTAEDLIIMTRLLASPSPALRIGQGWDVHALVPGRRLRLGGIPVPYERGLLGHSDADVLLHSITDALLGAAGLGDIGRHFPDTDPAYRGADSLQLMRQALDRVLQAGWAPVNLDCTVIAQAPKLATHIPSMVQSIADALGMDPGSVNVKAKTGERLGSAGRGESISAQAVVLLARHTA